MRRLEGRITLVTGGGAGVGRATSLRFASEGAKVVIGDIDLGGASAVVEQIVELGGEAKAVEGDAASLADCERMVAAAVEGFGGLGILVNNAGLPSRYNQGRQARDLGPGHRAIALVRLPDERDRDAPPDRERPRRNRQRLLHRRDQDGHARRLVRLRQGGRHRPHPLPGRRLRPQGRPRQRDVPRPHPHRPRAQPLGQPRSTTTPTSPTCRWGGSASPTKRPASPPSSHPTTPPTSPARSSPSTAAGASSSPGPTRNAHPRPHVRLCPSSIMGL